MYLGLRNLGLSSRRALSTTTFSPLSLFTSGEQGGWWDPSDFSTMFQDSLGTIPVTAAGQSVGLIRDKSGRGNHRTQSSAPSRPLLQKDGNGFFYLLYDGLDDSLNTATIDASTYTTVCYVGGILKNSDTTIGIIVETGSDSSASRAFAVFGPRSATTGDFGFRSRGSATADSIAPANYTAPFSAVLCGLGDVTNDGSVLRINGTVAAQSAVDQGTLGYGAQPWFFGRRAAASLPASIREYQTIIRVGTVASSGGQVTLAERFVGSRMGIVL